MKTRLIQMILLSGAVWTACGMDTARAEAVAQQPSQTETAEQVSEEQELEAQATTTPQQTADRQQAVKCWTLQECLDYALENNIQLRQNRNDYLSGVEDTKEARAALLPSLTASTTQAYTNYPSSNVSDNDSYTGTYGVNADLVLYQGGKLRTTVRRQQLQNRIDALTVEEAENDIRLALVEAYMQALYASEAVEIAVSTAEVSRAQRDRAREMWRTGSISKVDFAQIESQYVSDEYQVVVARTTLDNYKLQLKQLLELDITDEMELAAPAAGEDKVVTALPQKPKSTRRHWMSCPRSDGVTSPSKQQSWKSGRRAQASFRPFPLRPASAPDTCRAAHLKAALKYGTASTRMSGFRSTSRSSRTGKPHGRQQGAHQRLEQPPRTAQSRKDAAARGRDGLSGCRLGPVAVHGGRREAPLRTGELRPDRRAVPRRHEEHGRAHHGAERALVGPAGGPAGEVCRTAQHGAARHLPGRPVTAI